MFTSEEVWHLSQVPQPPCHLPLIDQIIYLDNSSAARSNADSQTDIKQELAKVNHSGPRQVTVQKVDVDSVPMGCFMAHIAALTQARTNGHLMVLEDTFTWDIPVDKLCQIMKSVPQHFEDRWHVLVLSPTLEHATPVADTNLLLLKRHKVWPAYVVNANYITTLLHTWMQSAFQHINLCDTWKAAETSDVWLSLNRHPVDLKSHSSLESQPDRKRMWHVKTVNMQVQVPAHTKSIRIHGLLRELYLEAEPGHRLRIAVYGPNLTKKRHKRALSVNSFAGVKYFETETEASNWLASDDIQIVKLKTTPDHL